MRELRFKYEGSYTIDYLAARITAIVDSDARCAPRVFLNEAGGKFQLGESNNWWLHHHKDTAEISITHRYWSANDPTMLALGEFLSRFLCLGWVNRPLTATQRIKEITGGDILLDEDSVFEYSWYRGGEKLIRKSSEKGGLEFRGQYHPDGTCEGGGVCRYCGRTI